MSTLPRSICLDKRDVPAVFLKAFPGYGGRKFAVEATESVTLQSNYWDGGTRYTYRGVDILNGTVLPPDCDEYGNPFINPNVPTVTLEPGRGIVCHKVFCGKDLGLTIYVHPDNVRKLLPAPVELSADESKALSIVCGIKGGPYRHDEWARHGLPGAYGPQNPVLCSLADRGLVKINRAGAVSPTIAGHNAR